MRYYEYTVPHVPHVLLLRAVDGKQLDPLYQQPLCYSTASALQEAANVLRKAGFEVTVGVLIHDDRAPQFVRDGRGFYFRPAATQEAT